mmetsp:Transcript_58590/g.188319  ORF Transcript_58590/g.188319 Transcript_58590/m.188319 type:complete len:421 (+) Transcript_58590:194-1456(+)
MAGHSPISPSLQHYFERKLRGKDDIVRAEPAGYCTAFHREAESVVLLHEASGIRVCPHAIDLVERVDRTKPPEAARVFYVYLPLAAFRKVAALAHREPHGAWRAMVQDGILRREDESYRGDSAWYGVVTAAEPAAVARGRAAGSISGWPWGAEDFCVALYMPTGCSRPAAGGGALELCLAGPEELAREYGTRLVEAAIGRDEQAVRSLLHARASPDFQDPRGWTALHAACSVRPRWEVLRQLLRVSNLCARTHRGELPCDIADAAKHEDVSQALKDQMQHDESTKYLPEAMSVLSAEARERLGLHQLDNNLAELKGRRRSDEEGRAMLRDFAMAVMAKYPNANAAFKAFDINQNGTLSASEFSQYTQQLRCECDVTAVFKALDIDRLGDISVSEFSVLQELHDEQVLQSRGGQADETQLA